MTRTPETCTKLNLGCGDLILPDHLNCDIAPREGVDCVFDLRQMPWPLPANQFERIELLDVLEHLPDLIGTVEELWRVSKHGAEVRLRVPYWNSPWAWMDPQHVRTFHENTFDFFDPAKKYCRQRPYYSHARFTVECVTFEGCWFFHRFPWKKRVPYNRPDRWINLAARLCDMVHFLQFDLRAIKPA